MIYLVNERTKEHKDTRLVPPYLPLGYLDWDGDKWYPVECDENGWVEWKGYHSCPLPNGARHEVKFISGKTRIDDHPETWGWVHLNDNTDIIAYRPILDTKPEPPAWDGSGLPPVGCECECSLDFDSPKESSNWHKIEVLYADESTVVGRIIEGLLHAHYSHGFEVSAYKFRPIRSEEDEAVEDMLAVNEYARDLEDFCHSLYRAGYRRI